MRIKVCTFWLMISLGAVAQAAPAGPSDSPFAGKPAKSYSAYKDDTGKEVEPLWGSAPLNDFGSRTVTFDFSGIGPVRQVPARACIHGFTSAPTICRTCAAGQGNPVRPGSVEEPAVLDRDDEGQVRRSRRTYAQPDVCNGGFGGLHGRVPLFRLGVPREGKAAYNHHPGGRSYLHSLIDGDATEFPDFLLECVFTRSIPLPDRERRGRRKRAGAAVVTALKADQARRAADKKAAATARSARRTGFSSRLSTTLSSTGSRPISSRHAR